VQLPALDSLENLDSSAIYCFRMVWGNLAADSGVTTPTDWSGKTDPQSRRGHRHPDHTLRTGPGFSGFRFERVVITGFSGLGSTTTTCSDGLALRLIIPPSPTDEIVTVAFESSQLSITFSWISWTIWIRWSLSVRQRRFVPVVPLRRRYRHGALAGVWGRDTTGLASSMEPGFPTTV